MKTFIIILIFCSCSNSYNYNDGKNDAYTFHKKGSKLELEDLKSANQFFFTKNNLLLVWNINPSDDEYFDPHLLFYDSSLSFYSACYLPSIKIDSIDGGNFYGEFIKVKNQRSKWYRNDLPNEFNLILNENDFTDIGSRNECNKIIDSLKYISKNLVTIYFKQTLDIYGGYDYINASGNIDSARIKFLKSSEFDFKLAQLNFNLQENRILIGNYEFNLKDKTKKMVWEIMLLSSEEVLNNFYNQVWDSITIHNNIN